MSIGDDVILGQNVIVYHPELVNLYGCVIGDNTRIAAFVEIGKGVTIGKGCKIEAFAFIPNGVTIEDNVFIGPHVCFTNDHYPRSAGDWTVERTTVREGASIGANATIVSGVTVGARAMVGAGAVVTKDVPAVFTYVGNPARALK